MELGHNEQVVPSNVNVSREVIMSKTNFQYEKRQRELEKKRRQEEKAKRKLEAKHEKQEAREPLASPPPESK